MRAGAEREARVEHEVDRVAAPGGVDQVGHDPQVVLDADRAELRLREAHPVLLGDAGRAPRTAARRRARCAAAASAASRVGVGGEQSAATRDSGHQRVALPGSA